MTKLLRTSPAIKGLVNKPTFRYEGDCNLLDLFSVFLLKYQEEEIWRVLKDAQFGRQRSCTVHFQMVPFFYISVAKGLVKPTKHH